MALKNEEPISTKKGNFPQKNKDLSFGAKNKNFPAKFKTCPSDRSFSCWGVPAAFPTDPWAAEGRHLAADPGKGERPGRNLPAGTSARCRGEGSNRVAARWGFAGYSPVAIPVCCPLAAEEVRGCPSPNFSAGRFSCLVEKKSYLI